MKRPLFVLWIGLVLGELCGQIMNLSGVLIPASLFLILRDRHCLIRLLQSGKGDVSWICRKSQKPFFILYLLFLLMMISGVFSWNIESYTLKKMEKFQEVNAGEETELCGEIYARKENAKGYVTYWITHLKTKDGKRSFSNGVSIIGKCEKDTSFYPGEEVVFTSKLEKLKERRNPGAFDEKNYYLSNGIFLTGFFTSIYRNPSSPKKLFSLKKWSYPVKVRIEQYYKKHLKEEDAAMLCAMIFGDKSGLSVFQKKLYEENGVAHLLAISGLHVSIMGGKIYQYFRKKKKGYGISCISAGTLLFFYGCMTGFGTSITRAYFMFLLYLGAEYTGMSYDLISSMSLAGILMLFEHPYRIMDGGFLISYAAITAIGIIIPMIHEKENIYKKNMEDFGEITIFHNKMRGICFRTADKLRDSFILFLATFPFIMRFYYECTPYCIFVNCLVIPWMNLILISGTISGITGTLSDIFLGSFSSILLKNCFELVGRVICYPALLLLRIYDQLFLWVRKLPGSLLITGCPSKRLMILIYIGEGILLFLWFRDYLKKDLLKRAILPLFLLFFFCVNVPQTQLTITMLDVGQGDCILFKLPDGKTMLIDGGSTTEKNVYTSILKPALYYYGINHLDYVVVTHMDEDHVSGIREMVEAEFPIRYILMGRTREMSLGGGEKKKKELINLARKNGTKTILLNVGESIREKGVSIQCCHPDEREDYLERNDESVVLLVKYKQFQGLFTGDLGMEQEESVLKAMKEKGPITLLKVGHHGSKHSTSLQLLSSLQPEYALISCGERNRYGHPHKELLQRLEKEKISIFQTRRGGAILVKTDGRKWKTWYWKD